MSDAEAMPQPSIGHRIVRAMFVIIFFQFFWKFGGLIITLLVGSVFGASPESDAYFFVSETVVFLLQTLCLKIFIPVMVPIVKEQMEQEGEEAAWRFASTVLNLVIVVLAVVTVGGMLFAPQITGLIAEGFNERQAALTTRLMRFMFPGVFAICLATVTYAILNSYNVFGYAAAGDAVQKMLWAGVFFVASLTGLAMARMLDAMAVAFLLGAGATLLTHLLGLRRKLRFYRLGLPALAAARIVKEAGILVGHVAALAAGLWVIQSVRGSLPSAGAALALQQAVLVVVVVAYLLLLGWRTRERRTPMAKFASLMVPLLFGILFAKYRDVLTNLFASFTGTGVFSDLKYARKVGEAPNTLVIAALSVAILPHLCELATGKKWTEFGDVMTHTIRSVVLFFVPLAALTVVLRVPIIQLLFDRGNWSDYHLVHAGDALGLYILSLPFFALENPIQQSFFAMQRMWTPTLIGFAGTGFHILFLFVGIEWLGFGYFAVVALVYVAARAFKNVILVLVMRVHVRILPWRPTLWFLGKGLVVTAGIVAAAHFTYQPLRRALPLDPYRRREVMIDTFNVEPRGWESDNVDDFRIVSKTDAKDAALLKGAFGTADVVGGENALMARYRRSPRRFAGLRRDLSDFDLGAVDAIHLDVACADAAEVVLELFAAGGARFRLDTIPLAPGTRQHVALPLDGLDERGSIVALWVLDASRADRVAAKATALVVDNLAFQRGQITRTIDGFEAATDTWMVGLAERPGGTWEPAAVQDTAERAREPELALHLDGAQEKRLVSRAISHYDLAGCDQLTLKARVQQACEVEFVLVHPSNAQDNVSVSVPFSASDRRRLYTVALPKLHPDSTASLMFLVPKGVDFWLDNVAFVRKPRGPRVRGLSLGYEALKSLHVAVPSLAALVVFVVLSFGLRIEEARNAWQWVREQGVQKLRAKLGRGKGKRT